MVCKMQCYIALLVLALTLNEPAIAATIEHTPIPKKEPSVNCTEYFAGFEDRVDIDKILGVWYQVTEGPNQVYCLDFEKLTDESRNKIEAEIKPYWNESNFGRYSIVVRRKCPGVVFNSTSYHLLAQMNDKGVFDTLFVPPNRSLTPLEATVSNTILVRTFELKGNNYLGILSCFHLKYDDASVILEREKNNYSRKEIKDFQFVFNNNKIINNKNIF